MSKNRMTYVTLGFGVLLVVVMVLLVWGGRRQSGEIILPESQSDGQGAEDGASASTLNVISLTPETVGSAVSVLARPSAYARTQTVETFWSGGSGQSVIRIYVSGDRTRLDETLSDGSVRHTLLAGGEPGWAAVWYDEETEWALLDVEDAALAADQTARIPTYETVRDLAVSDIARADYREACGGQCIYVETQPDADGYQDRYWVRVDSGLLAAAERLWQGELIYRLSADEPDLSPQEEALFLLPDGSPSPFSA